MTSITRLVDKLTARVIGAVDAGACDINHGCCCKGTDRPRWVLSCYGDCVYREGSRCNGRCVW